MAVDTFIRKIQLEIRAGRLEKLLREDPREDVRATAQDFYDRIMWELVGIELDLARSEYR